MYGIIKQSLGKLSADEQAYIKPFIMPPMEFSKWTTFNYYLNRMIDYGYLSQNKSYFCALIWDVIPTRAHGMAMRIAWGTKIITVYNSLDYLNVKAYDYLAGWLAKSGLRVRMKFDAVQTNENPGGCGLYTAQNMVDMLLGRKRRKTISERKKAHVDTGMQLGFYPVTNFQPGNVPQFQTFMNQ